MRSRGHPPARDSAKCCDENIRNVFYLFLGARDRVRLADPNVPFPRRLRVLRVDNLVVELDVTHKLVPIDDILEVFLDFVTWRVEGGPVALGGNQSGVGNEARPPADLVLK